MTTQRSPWQSPRPARLRVYLASADPSAVEWLEATVKIGVGLWFLGPSSVFATAPHLYAYAAAVMTERHWGALMVALRAAKLAAWYMDWRRARLVSSLVGGFFWGFYGFLFWASDHRSAGLVYMGTLAAFEMLAAVWLRARLPPGRQGREGRRATGQE